MDTDTKDTRPYETRLAEFRTNLTKLCKLYRIEILPKLTSTPNALLAQILFLDMNNKELLKKYGLEELPDEPPEDQSLNPVRN